MQPNRLAAETSWGPTSKDNGTSSTPLCFRRAILGSGGTAEAQLLKTRQNYHMRTHANIISCSKRCIASHTPLLGFAADFSNNDGGF